MIQILDISESFAALPGHQVKKVPLLRGRIITNLFFENSTRTRTTFEIAAKLLSANVINFNVNVSATANGALKLVDHGIFDLTTAIRKLTAGPADVLGS